MAFVVKNDLSKFAKKVENYAGRGELANAVIDKIAEKGKDIAQSKWGGSAIVSVQGDGLQRSVVARDTNVVRPTIAYREFGTGVLGKGSYEGKLPTQDINFTDAQGLKWTTHGWEYAYRYNQTHQGQPFKGQAAQMPMYEAGRELRTYIKTDLAKDIKKGG